MNSKYKVRLLLYSIGLACASVAPAQTRDESEIVLVGTNDPEMKAAIRAAREGLDTFLMIAEKPPAGSSGYKLKVMVTDGDIKEHFWVIPFRKTPEGFEGILANEPKLVKSVKQGQMIKFTRREVSDWGYVLNGRQVGSYTVCVLFKQMPADQANYYRKNHGFDC